MNAFTKQLHFWGIIMCLSVFCVLEPVYSATLYVPADYPTIQAAIDVAMEGDTILIRDGVYTGAGNSGLFFINKNLIIKSENGSDRCIIDCQDNDRFYESETSEIHLEGLSIINGNQRFGGAIRHKRGPLFINDCDFVNNYSSGYGGSISFYGDFSANPSFYLSTYNCTFRNNSTGGYGGAISIYLNCKADVIDCDFFYNKAEGYTGGAIYAQNRCNLNVIRSEFIGNTAFFGGAIYCYANNDALIENSIFSGNRAFKSSLNFRDGSGYGGAIFNSNTPTTIINSTVVGNFAETIGGGICERYSNISCLIVNNVLWGNISQKSQGSQIGVAPFDAYRANLALRYNCIEGGYGGVWKNRYDDTVIWGDGNIIEAPICRSSGYWQGHPSDPNAYWVSGDYHLENISPCIDAGDPDYVPDPDETDLDGNPRLFGSAVDMGCYEFIPNIRPIADAGPDQVIFAWINGLAQVQLHGTGSFDADGDVLEYFWYNDANELIATGSEPNVLFGVGQYEMTLIVNDGFDDSEPDTRTVTVIEPFETAAKMLPGTLNLKSGRGLLMGRIEFAGQSMLVLDPNEPMVLLVGQAQIQARDSKLVYSEEAQAWYLIGSFDSTAVIEAIIRDSHGQAELDRATLEVTLVCKFDTGQWVYGRDRIKVK